MAFAKVNKTIFYLHSDHIGRGYSTDFDYHDFSLWSDTPKFFSFFKFTFFYIQFKAKTMYDSEVVGRG
jgi:hypothetical protein